ncbi:hypothetical protein MHC_03805 [Mycoplasma haemocanis str. Illinois]|uniref:Uncharacterized protein n=1 Tax=Mycoplasma haemocanis (strain Illinois) TaxID=1111676 RepID=H6N7J9_MYCHN|nr:hypothetical protein [Mycoplasma haemocanis]AEW45621.1 hypothetical protein MHC_03805 [Mycoplasma haemocanis str. Illinois]
MGFSLAKGSLIGLGGVGALGAGGYLAFRAQQPTDVKSKLIWDGLSVADSKTLGVYKAIYLANSGKDGFSSFINSSNKEQAAPLLKEKCDALLGISASSDKYAKSLSEAKKWCLVPQKTTVEISLLLDDIEPSSSDDDYKNTFALSWSSQTFIDAIKKSDDNLTTSSDVASGFQKVKDWCTEAIKKSPLDKDANNAKLWCVKPDSKLSDFMDKQGFKTVDSNGWDSHFSSLSTDSTLTSDISSGSDGNGNKLKSWCEAKNLSNVQIHTLLSDLEKIKSRCFVKK